MVLLSALAALSLTSCDSDMDLVYVNPADDISLGGANGDIILSSEHPSALALTIYWSGDGILTLTDPNLQAPINAAEERIQLSGDENFTNLVEITAGKGVRQHQFLCEELNALLARLNFEPDKMAPLYIRIASSLAANVDPKYSSVLKVNVQPYSVRLILGSVLDKNGVDTGMTLASPEENGIYAGFLGVGSWYNWWFLDPTNVKWGNEGQSGKTFYASSAADSWNFWFPGVGGCYYTTVNTVEGWWSALHIDNVTVAGDITGEMTYNMKTNQWTLDFTSASAGTANITLSGAGSLYNKDTGDMGPAIAQDIAFGGESENLTFGTTGTTISVSVPAGATTLILDLTNPLAYKVGCGESEEPAEIDPHLYFSGLVNWDGFDDYLTLYDESGLIYGGAHYINSEWGYRVYTMEDWGAAYKATNGSTALSGSLIFAESDGNIPAPEPGLYVMDFDMKNLTYQLTAVESVTFAGLNDNWAETKMTQSAENPEIFTAEFVKEKETPWGVKVLINHDWSIFFGGGNGVLMLGHSDSTTGFDGDNDLTVGETYILKVDLGKQTYSYSLK